MIGENYLPRSFSSNARDLILISYIIQEKLLELHFRFFQTLTKNHHVHKDCQLGNIEHWEGVLP